LETSAGTGLAGKKVERRASRRFPVQWDAVIRGLDSAGNWFEETTKTKNVSSTGACLLVTGRLRAGATIDLSIKIPLGERSWMNYSGKVIRLRNNGSTSVVSIRFNSPRPVFFDG
jgi:PilZ domain